MSGARLASSAIRSSFVLTLCGVDVPCIFPSNDPMSRCHPLLRGVPWVGSPTSSLLLRHSDFPCPRSLSSSPCLPGSTSPWRSRDLPGSWGTLPCAPRSFPTPAGPLCADHRAEALPSAYRFRRRIFPNRRLLQLLHFEAQSRGIHARCLRFAVTVARLMLTTTQDSLPGGGLSFPGQDSNLLGSAVRFLLRTYIASP